MCPRYASYAGSCFACFFSRLSGSWVLGRGHGRAVGVLDILGGLSEAGERVGAQARLQKQLLVVGHARQVLAAGTGPAGAHLKPAPPHCRLYTRAFVFVAYTAPAAYA